MFGLCNEVDVTSRRDPCSLGDSSLDLALYGLNFKGDLYIPLDLNYKPRPCPDRIPGLEIFVFEQMVNQGQN